MLARAVVVDLARRFMGKDQAVALRPVIGLVRPAAQVVLGHSQIGKPATDHSRMDRGSLMAGAGQRQLRLAQSRRVRRPAFDQRQGLKHLAGGARKDHRLGVAPSLDDLARRVADHRVAGVDALHPPAAPQFDHRKCSHLARHVATSPHLCANSCPQGLSRPAAFALWGDIELKRPALPEKVAAERVRFADRAKGSVEAVNEWQHG